MNGLKPGGILTDQCASIDSGIRHVLGPQTLHIYCLWHILHKLPSKWGQCLIRFKKRIVKNMLKLKSCIPVQNKRGVWRKVVEEWNYGHAKMSSDILYNYDVNIWVTLVSVFRKWYYCISIWFCLWIMMLTPLVSEKI